jgi:D-alanyl-lipoteichoic acid acyltransferase DltB (MBOAT superfamily)
MHLISEAFLFFAVAFCAVFFVLGCKEQKIALVIGSYLFCGIAGLIFPVVLLFSTVANYAVSSAMEAYQTYSRRILALGVIGNVLLLASFKYVNFMSQSLSDASEAFGFVYSPLIVKLAIPLGLSFYTFQAISYLIDFHHKKFAKPSFLDFAVYLSFWPKFTAGPIIRAGWLLPQLQRARKFRWPNFFLGAEMIVFGLFLKTVISDHLVPHISKVFETPAAYDGAATLLAVFLFTFQIYGDFAGYSLIVIGIARILGFSILPNFRRPNYATSFSDFWTRWHISLSTWLNDYVFRSLIRKQKRLLEARWPNVRSLFSEMMGIPNVSDDATFTSLAADSLAYVEITLALEGQLGNLPMGWESMTARELDAWSSR